MRKNFLGIESWILFFFSSHILIRTRKSSRRMRGDLSLVGDETQFGCRVTRNFEERQERKGDLFVHHIRGDRQDREMSTDTTLVQHFSFSLLFV